MSQANDPEAARKASRKALDYDPKDARAAAQLETLGPPPVALAVGPGARPLDQQVQRAGLSHADISEVVTSNRSGIAKCVVEHRERYPAVHGKLVMKWKVQVSGEVSNVWVESEELKGTPLAICVGALIKNWRFPPATSEGDPVVFPFRF